MDVSKIVDTVIAPVDPLLARRIRALLRAYARGEMRHQVQRGRLVRPRRDERERPPDEGATRDPADDA